MAENYEMSNCSTLHVDPPMMVINVQQFVTDRANV